MTQRERSLFLVVLAVGGFLVLGGGVITAQNLFENLDQKDQEIASLQSEVSGNDAHLLALGKAQKTLEQRRTIGLPPDLETSKTGYRAFLRALCDRHELEITQPIKDSGLSQTSGPTRGAKVFTPLDYQVLVRGTLAHLIDFLREFYTTNLLHQVREITISSTGTNSEDRLEILLKVEALSLPKAPRREFVLPAPGRPVLALEVAAALQQGPTGLATSLWLLTPVGVVGSKKLAASAVPGRDYDRLVNKNVFVGLRAPAGVSEDRDLLKFVHLTNITGTFIHTQAVLYNRLTNTRIRLRDEEPFDSLEVRDAQNRVVLKGKVNAVNPRSVDFTVGDKKYRIAMGQNLYEVLRPDRLSEIELKALTLDPTAVVKNP
jgi:hypothetical protein